MAAGMLIGALGPWLVREITGRVLTGMVQDPQVPVNRHNAAPASAVVHKAVEEVVREEVVPRLEHATNNEPWYRSRVTLGAIAVLIGTSLRAFGVKFDPGMETALAEFLFNVLPYLLNAGGAALALYGRWAARKPLGSR